MTTGFGENERGGDAFRHTFTVFTATFNRADELPRVRESLLRQTYRDFEWLIVDDGSTDGTSAMVAGWRSQTDFPIRYIHQAHAGKHVAFNKGVREAVGRFFLTLDSDDEAVPNALERFVHHWDSIPAASRDAFSAVTALCIDANGRPVGDRFPWDVTDSDSVEQYFKYKVRGEKWGFQRTDVLREHPFPEPARVTFVPEALVWFAIARRYRTRYVNEYLRIYHADPSAPRLSNLTVDTALGRLLFHKMVIEDYPEYLVRSPILFAKSLIAYSRYSWLSGTGAIAQLRALRTSAAKLLVAPAIVLAGLLALRDRRPTRQGEITR